jgi:hypothetical protein
MYMYTCIYVYICTNKIYVFNYIYIYIYIYTYVLSIYVYIHNVYIGVHQTVPERQLTAIIGSVINLEVNDDETFAVLKLKVLNIF